MSMAWWQNEELSGGSKTQLFSTISEFNPLVVKEMAFFSLHTLHHIVGSKEGRLARKSTRMAAAPVNFECG